MSTLYNVNSFLTFRNVAVPDRPTINKAFVRFTAVSSALNDDDNVLVMISGEDADTGSTPTDAAEANAIVETTSCINWDNIEHWTAESTYDSVDISCVIQEICDRAGWESGNDITILVRDYNSSGVGLDQLRVPYDYDESSTKSPKLYIYYTLDEEGSDGVVVGGSSVTSQVYSPTISPAGVTCGGSADVGGITTYLIESAGVVLDGWALGRTYNEVIAPAGVTLSGSATISIGYVPVGGLLCAGSAPYGGSQSVTASGGAVCDSVKYLGKYYQRVLVTISANMIPEDQTGFTWVAKIYVGEGQTITRAGASDLSENLLPCKLALYNSATGYLLVDTKLDVAAGSDTSYYVYF